MPTTKEKKEKKTIETPGGKYNYANGKRKTSIARVRIYKGAGAITINNLPAKDYLDHKVLMGMIKSPLKLTGNDKNFDVVAVVSGGGKNGQAEAIRHGIAKVLVEMDPLNKPTLKKAGMLTRDPRMKERKKPGLKKARKAPQFSKR